jgi:hypothetical protein
MLKSIKYTKSDVKEMMDKVIEFDVLKKHLRMHESSMRIAFKVSKSIYNKKITLKYQRM